MLWKCLYISSMISFIWMHFHITNERMKQLSTCKLWNHKQIREQHKWSNEWHIWLITRFIIEQRRQRRRLVEYTLISFVRQYLFFVLSNILPSHHLHYISVRYPSPCFAQWLLLLRTFNLKLFFLAKDVSVSYLNVVPCRS